jgi:ribonuclease E
MNIILDKIIGAVNRMLKPHVVIPPIITLEADLMVRTTPKPKKQPPKRKPKKKAVVVETPVVETPVVETPVVETPVVVVKKRMSKPIRENKTVEHTTETTISEPVEDSPQYIAGEIEIGDTVVMNPALRFKIYYIEGEFTVINVDKSIDVITLYTRSVTRELKYHSSQFYIVKKNS